MKKEKINENEQNSDSSLNVNRRKFLGNLGKTAVAAAAIGTIAPLADEKSFKVSAQRGLNSVMQLANKCYTTRVNAAQANLNAISMYLTRDNNGDELQYPNRIGSYSKGLPHQSNGEVVPSAYNSLLNALKSGSPALFEQIPMGGDRKLTNPQSGLAFDMEGADCFSFIQKAPPAFSTKEIAAEIAENYWMAILRDVPYSDYEANQIAAAAAADLTQFGADFKGAKDTNGQVTPRVLFRGLTAGDKAGPYLSQFFYQPCFFGANEVNQKIRTVRGVGDGGQNYMTDFSS